jgi:hypothetical protein
MTEIGSKAAANADILDQGQTLDEQQAEEQRSKDAFYEKIGQTIEAMIARHGKEFTIGTLILAARFIAEDRPLTARKNGHDEPMAAPKPV